MFVLLVLRTFLSHIFQNKNESSTHSLYFVQIYIHISCNITASAVVNGLFQISNDVDTWTFVEEGPCEDKKGRK